MELMTIEFQATPFRAKRFQELYEPAAARVLVYGATDYVFFRSVDDPDHFVHLSTWERREDFDRYWFSRDMQNARAEIAGLHNLPVMPHWNYLVARG